MEKKLIKEEGFVLSREIKEATEEFKGQDGRVVPAQPKRFMVTVVTSSFVDKNDGMAYMTFHKPAVVEEKIYEKLTYRTPVVVIYEYIPGQNGGAFTKIQSITPIENK